jgi:hypothetical protein
MLSKRQVTLELQLRILRVAKIAAIRGWAFHLAGVLRAHETSVSERLYPQPPVTFPMTPLRKRLLLIRQAKQNAILTHDFKRAARLRVIETQLSEKWHRA